MARLRSWLALVAVVVAAPAQAGPVDRWHVFIAEASARFGIPERWIERVMKAESGGRTMAGDRPIRSVKGAMGLMQLMPGTWADMRARHALGDDPDDPRDNILAGTAYLRLMFDRFGYPGLFGAYNAGPARYAAHLGGKTLPAETVAYLAAVSPEATIPRVARPRSEAIFVVRRDAADHVPSRSESSPAASLFAVRYAGH